MTDLELAPWTLDCVPGDAMPIWAEALRDDNPIHLDPDAAEALGFGRRTVNQGPANLAYVLNMLIAARPGEYLETVEARFLGNVFSGDRVVATGGCDSPEARTCMAALTRGEETDPVLTVRALFRDPPA